MIVLFRKGLDEESEFEIASKFFVPGVSLFEFRSNISSGSIVVGRYSVLPFYQELQKELELSGSRLINDFQSHSYIANMEWLPHLEGITPRTYFEWGNLPKGRYVVKGITNSRKFHWDTHMFAPTREDVPKVAARLLDDTMIREQGLVVREYAPLKKIGEQINGLPVTVEYRFFCYGKTILTSGFYWSNYEGEVPTEPPEAARELVLEALSRIPTLFVVVDVAECEDGSWVVVELNDGQMSGLSCCSAETLYKKLSELVI